MNEQVSIIILNYNGKKYLYDCIDSVLKQSYSNFEIILFDNNSEDGSIDYIKSNFIDQRIKIIPNNKNLGFAGGNNKAIEYCKNDIIILLNNDTICDKNWLKDLVSSLEVNSIATSYVITKGIPEKYYKTNGSVSYLMYNIMNIFPNIDDIFYPNGCSLIFRNSEIGLPFDEDYYFYGEDVYLGLKARFNGMKIKFVKTSIVHHIGEGSKTSSLQKTFFTERNRLLNLFTFFSIGFIIRIVPYIIFYSTANILHSLFSKKKSVIGLIKAYIWLLFNINKIIEKRNIISKNKRVNEKEIIKYVSCKICNDDNLIYKSINRVSYLYSRLLQIKPIEYYLRNL